MFFTFHQTLALEVVMEQVFWPTLLKADAHQHCWETSLTLIDHSVDKYSCKNKDIKFMISLSMKRNIK